MWQATGRPSHVTQQSKRKGKPRDRTTSRWWSTYSFWCCWFASGAVLSFLWGSRTKCLPAHQPERSPQRYVPIFFLVGHENPSDKFVHANKDRSPSSGLSDYYALHSIRHHRSFDRRQTQWYVFSTRKYTLADIACFLLYIIADFSFLQAIKHNQKIVNNREHQPMISSRRDETTTTNASTLSTNWNKI